MRVADLIETLEGLNQEAEVRFASQPNWPFEYSIADVVEMDPGAPNEGELTEARKEAAEGDEGAARFLAEAEAREPEPVVYLVEGRQLGYLPGVVARELGWGR